MVRALQFAGSDRRCGFPHQGGSTQEALGQGSILQGNVRASAAVIHPLGVADSVLQEGRGGAAGAGGVVLWDPKCGCGTVTQITWSNTRWRLLW